VSLPQFILANMERILQRWEDFARSLEPGRTLGVTALRNDAERMLRFIAADMQTPQSVHEQFDKSVGQGAESTDAERTAGRDHGIARAIDNFNLIELVSEYRALRSTVTSLWLAETAPSHETALELVRFGEAIDQVLAESVDHFSSKIDKEADLFTASIGHDLRNPLNAIAMAGLLLNASGTLDPAARSAVAQIQLSVRRIENMLQQLGDFTRVRLGAMVGYDRRRTNVAEVCRHIVEEIQTSHPTRKLSLREDGDMAAMVDPSRIGELLSNIIANAVQHGSFDGEVAVHAYADGDDVRVDVHNTGLPIPPDQIETLFEPLRRGRTTRARDPGSLGLGLYIARTIAIAHGGDIQVVCDASGTTFRTILPRHGQPSAGIPPVLLP
jgi:signal transduction histidine kinase